MNPIDIARDLVPRIAERAPAYDRDAAFPAADIEDLRDAGLLGLLVPEALGGMGGSFLDYVRVATTLAAGSGATALIYNMHASVTGALATAPEELARELGAGDAFFAMRDRVLGEAAKGAIYGVGITERKAGSRLSAMETTYEREGDGYRLRGQKAVCSGAGHLDRYLVAARAADAPAGEDGRVSYFLIPGGDGLKPDATWDPLGMRATASNGFTIDQWVPADTLVGVEGLAVLMAYALPQWLVASYAAVYVGVAEAALAEAVRHIAARVAVPTGGGAAAERGGLAKLASVRARLGRADAEVAAVRLALERAAEEIDARQGETDTNRWIYRAKLLAGDVAQRTAASVAEACGLGALRRGTALERIIRDARCGAIMPPPSDVCADVLGAAALDLDPFASDVRPW